MLNQLVTDFVDAAVEQLRRTDLMRWPGKLPDPMRDESILPSDDWIGWKPVPGTVTDSDLDALEHEVGLAFPPLYRDFLKYRHFVTLTEFGVRFERRWLVIIPVALIIARVFAGGKISGANPGVMFWFGVLIVAPVTETLIECTLPYWIMRKLTLVPHDRRPWGFVITAAVMMILLHASAWPAAIIPSFVTGAFLGYTYGHFAPLGFRQAFLHTSIFHACINLVGGILIAAG